MVNEEWFETNEAEDVAGSIRHVLRCFEFTRDDPQAWKWVFLALHGALQGACVAYLTTTASPIGAVSEKNAKKWIKYFEDSRDQANLIPPDTYLMGLPELLKKVRNEGSGGSSNSTSAVNITDSELDWLNSLHEELRNQFIHFQSCSWSIDISGIPSFAHIVARIVSEILSDGWAFRHMDEQEREKLETDLERLSRVPVLGVIASP